MVLKPLTFHMRASHRCDAGISLSNQSVSNLSHVQPWGLIYASPFINNHSRMIPFPQGEKKEK
jgi:hypothetical protein